MTLGSYPSNIQPHYLLVFSHNLGFRWLVEPNLLCGANERQPLTKGTNLGRPTRMSSSLTKELDVFSSDNNLSMLKIVSSFGTTFVFETTYQILPNIEPAQFLNFDSASCRAKTLWAVKKKNILRPVMN